VDNVTPIRKESQHPALASMRIKMENLEKEISSLNKQLEFLRNEIKKLGA
jgi:chaperonin cofactor prefoldin